MEKKLKTDIDVAIDKFNIAYLDNSGELEYNRNKIFNKYLNTWFFIDFGSNISIDKILNALG